jgi:hypothetical protein
LIDSRTASSLSMMEIIETRQIDQTEAPQL